MQWVLTNLFAEVLGSSAVMGCPSGLCLLDPLLAGQHCSSAPVSAGDDCLQASCAAHPARDYTLQPAAMERPPAHDHLHIHHACHLDAALSKLSDPQKRCHQFCFIVSIVLCLVFVTVLPKKCYD